STSALQAQGRRAFERKREIYITDFVALLKIIFSLDGNIIGCPPYLPYYEIRKGDIARYPPFFAALLYCFSA
ncbi:MAG: hypothetical protein WAW09_08890, partial [Smithella sp.]